MLEFDGTDACVTPVLDFDEALKHPHAIARGGFMQFEGIDQPSPAPRMSLHGARPMDAPVRLPDPMELAQMWL